MKRTMTIKMMAIAALVMIMMIPLTLIKDVVRERSHYREEVRQSIAESWTGDQTLVGPLLVVPYKEYYTTKVWDVKLKQYQSETNYWERQLYIAPEKLTIVGDVATDERSRGIYAIPVYTSELAISGHYGNQRMQEVLKQTQNRIEWQPAHLSVLVSDVRGVSQPPQLQWQGKGVEFESGPELGGLTSGMHAEVGELDPEVEILAFDFKLALHGMERLQFSPLGKGTEVRLSADWPHPSFLGRYLPDDRTIDTEQFTARWNVSSFSSGMSQLIERCEAGACGGILEDTFGVTLFNSVDIYQQSERSVKYAMLFIGLSFIAFFLFEVMKGLRLHPMQYLLVGLGLSVFYLLLISLSEHIAFFWAYLSASLASTAVIGFYLSGILHSLRSGSMLSAALLLLYAMLYAILRSEDNALLMGSLLIFSVLSMVMVVTRRVDWYVIGEKMAIHTTDRAEGEMALES